MPLIDINPIFYDANTDLTRVYIGTQFIQTNKIGTMVLETRDIEYVWLSNQPNINYAPRWDNPVTLLFYQKVLIRGVTMYTVIAIGPGNYVYFISNRNLAGGEIFVFPYYNNRLLVYRTLDKAYQGINYLDNSTFYVDPDMPIDYMPMENFTIHYGKLMDTYMKVYLTYQKDNNIIIQECNAYETKYIKCDLVSVPSNYTIYNSDGAAEGDQLYYTKQNTYITTPRPYRYLVYNNTWPITTDNRHTMLIVQVNSEDTDNIIISSIPDGKKLHIKGESGIFTGGSLEYGKGTIKGYLYSSIVETDGTSAEDDNLILYALNEPSSVYIDYTKVDMRNTLQGHYYYREADINTRVKGNLSSIIPKAIIDSISKLGYTIMYAGLNFQVSTDSAYVIESFDPYINYSALLILISNDKQLRIPISLVPILRENPQLYESYEIISTTKGIIIDLPSRIANEELKKHLIIYSINGNTEYDTEYTEGNISYSISTSGKVGLRSKSNTREIVKNITVKIGFTTAAYGGVEYDYHLNIYIDTNPKVLYTMPTVHINRSGVFKLANMTYTSIPSTPIEKTYLTLGTYDPSATDNYTYIGEGPEYKLSITRLSAPVTMHFKDTNELYIFKPLDTYLPKDITNIKYIAEYGKNHVIHAKDILNDSYFTYSPYIEITTDTEVGIYTKSINIIPRQDYNVGAFPGIVMLQVRDSGTIDITRGIDLSEANTIQIHANDFFRSTDEAKYVEISYKNGIEYTIDPTGTIVTFTVLSAGIYSIEVFVKLPNSPIVTSTLNIIAKSARVQEYYAVQNVPLLLPADTEGLVDGQVVAAVEYKYSYSNNYITFTDVTADHVVTFKSIEYGTIKITLVVHPIQLRNLADLTTGLTLNPYPAAYKNLKSTTQGVRIFDDKIYIADGITEVDLSYTYYNTPHEEKVPVYNAQDIKEGRIYYFMPNIPFYADLPSITGAIEINAKWYQFPSADKREIIIENYRYIFQAAVPVSDFVHCFNANIYTKYNYRGAGYTLSCNDPSLVNDLTESLSWSSTSGVAKIYIATATETIEVLLDNLNIKYPKINLIYGTAHELPFVPLEKYNYTYRCASDLVKIKDNAVSLSLASGPKHASIRYTDTIIIDSGAYDIRIPVAVNITKGNDVKGVSDGSTIKINTKYQNIDTPDIYPYPEADSYNVIDNIITIHGHSTAVIYTMNNINIYRPLSISTDYRYIEVVGEVNKDISITTGSIDLTINVDEPEFTLTLVKGKGLVTGKMVGIYEWLLHNIYIKMTYTATNGITIVNSFDDTYLSVAEGAPTLVTYDPSITNVKYQRLSVDIFERNEPINIKELLAIGADMHLIYLQQDNTPLLSEDDVTWTLNEASIICAIYLQGEANYLSYRFKIKLKPYLVKIPPSGITFTINNVTYTYSYNDTIPKSNGHILDKVSDDNVTFVEISQLRKPPGTIINNTSPAGYDFKKGTHLSINRGVDYFSLTILSDRTISKYDYFVTKALTILPAVRISIPEVNNYKPFSDETDIIAVSNVQDIIRIDKNTITLSGVRSNMHIVVHNNRYARLLTM